jgi:uncharacterized membrane protein YidH (DUF202 family)
MTGRRGSALVPLTPLAMVLGLAFSWPLPLAWTSLALATIVLVTLLVASLTQARRAASPHVLNESITAAACCLAGIGLIALAYAAFALTTAGSFAGATRLVYPFLIATRLYLRGGLVLLLLCAVVGSVPLLFQR